MIEIQQAGTEILQGKPRSLYFFCGSEYGIKKKYLQHLSSLFSESVESDSLADLFSVFERKNILAAKPKLYICRYDTDFIKQLDEAKASKVLALHIDGCIIAIYEDEKSYSKLNKFFPDNVTRFDGVSTQHVTKYLSKDYTRLDPKYISLAALSCKGGYGHANIVCYQMNILGDAIESYSEGQLLRIFGLRNTSTEQDMRICVAARSFSGTMNAVDQFEGDINYLLNNMCLTAINLDRCMDKKHTDLPEAKYVRKWTRADIYNFFDNTYTAMLQLRSNIGGDVYNRLIYLASLLLFDRIPSVEELR